jgi:hypothetical protein
MKGFNFFFLKKRKNIKGHVGDTRTYQNYKQTINAREFNRFQN